MLGSSSRKKRNEKKTQVSKPYRYARKLETGDISEIELVVSKPYRYARKKKTC